MPMSRVVSKMIRSDQIFVSS